MARPTGPVERQNMQSKNFKFKIGCKVFYLVSRRDFRLVSRRAFLPRTRNRVRVGPARWEGRPVPINVYSRVFLFSCRSTIFWRPDEFSPHSGFRLKHEIECASCTRICRRLPKPVSQVIVRQQGTLRRDRFSIDSNPLDGRWVMSRWCRARVRFSRDLESPERRVGPSHIAHSCATRIIFVTREDSSAIDGSLDSSCHCVSWTPAEQVRVDGKTAAVGPGRATPRLWGMTWPAGLSK
jgi:hypothetical protein